MLPPVPLIALFKVMVEIPVLDTVKALAPKLPVLPVMIKLKPPLMVDGAVTEKLLGTAFNVALACKVPPPKNKVPLPIAALLPIIKVPAVTVLPLV